MDSETPEKVRTATRVPDEKKDEGCSCVCRGAQGGAAELSSENQRLKKRIEREMQENDRLRQDL